MSTVLLLLKSIPINTFHVSESANVIAVNVSFLYVDAHPCIHVIYFIGPSDHISALAH